jgi:hypothetical protein
VTGTAYETNPAGNTPTQPQHPLLTSATRHGKLTPDLLANGGFDNQPIYQEVCPG